MKKENWDVYIGVFFVSFAVIGLEMVFNRLFAVRYWYHFAFMIISIALFGIGVGSLIVFFLNRWLSKIQDITLATVSALFGILVPLILLKTNAIPLEIDVQGIKPLDMDLFVPTFLLLSIPFVLAGFTFSFLFTNKKDDINNIYFLDLLGGGLGALFALLIFPGNGPFMTAFIFSLFVLCLPGLFLFKRIRWFTIAIPVLLLSTTIVLFLPNIQKAEVRVSKDKKYTYPLYEKVFAGWDNFGYTAVHKKDEKGMVATANYSSYANLFDTSTPEKMESFRNHEVMKEFSHPFVVKPKPDVVGIIGVGAGKDILISLLNGAKEIHGAEFNPTMFKVNRVFKEYTGGIIDKPNVHVKMAEGRFFIRSSPRKYDILLFDNAIAVAAVQSGAFTLAEGYLYTVEAIMEYMEKLKPGGILYLSNPFPDYQRFITISREAFKRLGRETEFRKSVWVADNQSKVYRRCKVMIKNGPYTDSECALLAQYATSSGHAVLYAPNGKGELKAEPDETGKDVSTTGTRAAAYARYLSTTKDIEKAYAKATSEIRPSTDDWPFYSQTVKLEKKSYEWAKKNKSLMYSAPFLLIRDMMRKVLSISLLFLILPLVLFNLKGFKELDNKLGSILYFASLGLGFMFIEIVLMQKYQLILGHPIYAFAVVLSTIMISSGIGSFFCERFRNPYNAIHVGIAGILITTFLAWLFVRYLGHSVIDWPFPMRVLLVTLLVSASGFFMGFMMPSGIRAISASGNAIPWLWSINAVFSTVAGFLSINISILHGFTWVLAAGILVYLLGWLAFTLRIKISFAR
jgi:spermidine synthase